ncbi:RAVE subunit 2/Rogdi [Podospora didyma]|uniref:RAVE subunit 2/Rogdi n=1 Tax=Podospora didyma TaxID=330526 RepID=A0AAE0N651_9PEZI|nr:RAVE subunit 2/Rogdi [Podospora didyma]
MSVEIWPPIAPEKLKIAVETTQKRELDWLIEELHETLTNLKHGLEDCYALLAPIDPGSTLVLSTPRNETIKGHVTRVGTRIVKGTIYLRMRTLPHQTLTISPDHPIHLWSLTSLNTLLTHSIDLLTLTLSYSYPSEPVVTTATRSPSISSEPAPVSSPDFLAAQLRLLSQSLSEASSILKGPPLTTADPSWTTRSVSPSHFSPPPIPPHSSSSSHSNKAPPLSFHLGIQDSCLVLWLRSLEPADAPVNFSTKLALAIGTTRRLEHDESERVFGFCCSELEEPSSSGHSHGGRTSTPASLQRHQSNPVATSGRREVEVYVREKVRVESADPSLLSLSSKLTSLGQMLAVARRNLAAVMGEEEQLED